MWRRDRSIRQDLEILGQPVDRTWTIDRNWDITTAVIKKGRYTEKIWKLLTDTQREASMPLSDDRVPSNSLGGSPRKLSSSLELAPPTVRSPVALSCLARARGAPKAAAKANPAPPAGGGDFIDGGDGRDEM